MPRLMLTLSPRPMLTLSPRLSQRSSLRPSQKPIQELRLTLELMPTPMLTLSLRLMPMLKASGAGSLIVVKDAIPVPLQRQGL